MMMLFVKVAPGSSHQLLAVAASRWLGPGALVLIATPTVAQPLPNLLPVARDYSDFVLSVLILLILVASASTRILLDRWCTRYSRTSPTSTNY